MKEEDIIRYANENLWFLREGDYLPERLRGMNNGRGVGNIGMLEEMRQLGTVYPTRQVAMMVSEKVRVLLSQASLECLVSTNKSQDNVQK